MKKKKTLGPNFLIDNALVTIRYKSELFITPIFDKKVINYVLSCEFPLNKFNTSFFKDYIAALLFIDVGEKMYVARVGDFIATLDPRSISLDLMLSNIQLKDAWDLEHLTPTTFYNDNVLTNKKFFVRSGKSLDSMVSPLGLSRKFKETDQAFRRRVIEYLQFKTGSQMTDIQIKNLTTGKESDEGGDTNE